MKTLGRANGDRRCVPRGVQAAKVEPNWMFLIENGVAHVHAQATGPHERCGDILIDDVGVVELSASIARGHEIRAHERRCVCVCVCAVHDVEIG
jgi:hypothetical protein